MPETTETKNERVLLVGPDRVTVSDDRIIIEAKHEMPDWEVRTYQAPAIYFEEKKYILKEKENGAGPYPIRYVLLPWPVGKVANPKAFYRYDAATVGERDSERRGEALAQIVWICLLPLYPFLGLLWSGLQQRLHRFGFLPRTITGLSIFTVFGLMLTQGVFIALLLQASARSGALMIGGIMRIIFNQNYLHVGPVNFPVIILDILLIVTFLADVGIRYTHYLRDDQWTGGFLEWLLPKRGSSPA